MAPITLNNDEVIDIERLALQRNRYPDMSDADFRFMLQQIEGRQRTKQKLPSFALLQDWWYPVRLSLEQCSNELTAQYKCEILGNHPLLQSGRINDDKRRELRVADLTGGYGVDSYFFSRWAAHVDYVECDEELCRIATHNFSTYATNIHIHHGSAEELLTQLPPCDVIYMDPPRRNKGGGKVFRLEECTPNLLSLLPTLKTHAKVLLFKLSPMLDITSALRGLDGYGIAWDVHVVAINNEVKEVLLLSGSTNSAQTAVNIISHHGHMERQTVCANIDAIRNNTIPAYADRLNKYLYEPNTAILKAGMFHWIEKYAVTKLGANTHLYTSDKRLGDFPGRTWRVLCTDIKHVQDIRNITADGVSIVTRNYPLTPEQIRKKFKLHDGDNYYLIGARLGNKPTLLLCERLQ